MGIQLTVDRSAAGTGAAVELRVFAAGSLRAALTEAARAFERDEPDTVVRFTFGASGLLKDRIVAGERADVFASANLDHPQALAASGRAGAVQPFARNAMCVLVAPSIDVTHDTLVECLLDPAVRVGTSTPKADPSGDYAWMVFERIEQQGRRGAFRQLAGKALRLTGGPDSPPPREGRDVYATLVSEGEADVFVTYRTNAVAAVAQQPALRWLPLPDSIDVSADYGLTVCNAAPAEAGRFAAFVLSPAGQAILARHGFVAAGR